MIKPSESWRTLFADYQTACNAVAEVLAAMPEKPTAEQLYGLDRARIKVEAVERRIDVRGGPTQLDRISGFISGALRVKPPALLVAK
jgi:hypothetical protein